MSEVFFISDTHWGHKNIIKFESTKEIRNFDTIEEHDEELVRRWNSVVSPKDTVWHLGDVAFGLRNLHHVGRCNGNKKLVMGNHDMYGIDEYLKYFDRVFGVVEYKGMILSHIPVHPRELESRYFMNVHGHLHTNNVTVKNSYVVESLPHDSPTVIPPGKIVITNRNTIEVHPIEANDSRYVNVSCEQINLTPIPYDEILNKWQPKEGTKV